MTHHPGFPIGNQITLLSAPLAPPGVLVVGETGNRPTRLNLGIK